MQSLGLRSWGAAKPAVALLGFAAVLIAGVLVSSADAGHTTSHISNNSIGMPKLKPALRNRVIDAQSPTIVATPDHGEVGGGYATAETIDEVELERGEYMVSASGAANFDRFSSGEGPSPNCGLRQGDTLLAKQNIASESDAEIIQRGGFSVVGAATVEDEATVELVCYGATVFEHNIVAIGD